VTKAKKEKERYQSALGQGGRRKKGYRQEE